jgi:hypothetical protein
MKRFWMLAGAFLVTIAALGIALLLGSLGFDYHRKLEHEVLLRQVVSRQWTADRLTRWLGEVKGAPLLAVLRTPADVERLIALHGGRKAAEIRGKAVRHAETRVYRAGDMLYFIYFDAGGVIRDFTCVSR